MKTTTTVVLITGIMLFTACAKENTTIQSSGTTDESAAQAFLSGTNQLAGPQAVRIGTQVWKIKDLTTSFYRNRDKIPQVNDPAKWAKLTTGAWCWYNNDPRYGKLYNWYAVNDARGLAPAGWHIPSDSEWTTLTILLGGEALAGDKMKESGTSHWLPPNTGATNSSGFTALPGGYRDYYGEFHDIGSIGYWWSSTMYNVNFAWARDLFNDNGYIARFSIGKQVGLSVRCIKD